MKKFSISNYRWTNNGYEPEAWGELKLTPDTLNVKLTCIEKEPLARHNYGPDAPVHCDSCLEFFFSLDGGKHYVNIEMNAGGGYLCAYRTSREDKAYIDLLAEDGIPKATVLDDRWYAEATFDLNKLKKAFNIDKITELKGNFYKCGDETKFPHFGMWNTVLTEKPDFHRPEYFADIPLGDIS